MELRDFIVALARDSRLRRRYHRSPDRVADELGLPDEEKEALLVATPEELLRFIPERARRFLGPSVVLPLPGPCPEDSNFEIVSATPSTGLQGKPLDVTIVAAEIDVPLKSQPFTAPPPGVTGFIKCWLQHEGTDQIIPGKRKSGPDRQPGGRRRGVVTFEIPQDAALGTYELRIWSLTIQMRRASAFTVLEGVPSVIHP